LLVGGGGGGGGVGGGGWGGGCGGGVWGWKHGGKSNVHTAGKVSTLKTKDDRNKSNESRRAANRRDYGGCEVLKVPEGTPGNTAPRRVDKGYISKTATPKLKRTDPKYTKKNDRGRDGV